MVGTDHALLIVDVQSDISTRVSHYFDERPKFQLPEDDNYSSYHPVVNENLRVITINDFSNLLSTVC